MLGDGPAHLDDRRLLEGVGADHRRHDLAGDGDDGDAVQFGVGQAGHEVGRSGAAGSHADSDPSGGPGIALGREPAALLVAGENGAQPITDPGQGLMNRHAGPTRIGEDDVYPVVEQALHDDVGSGLRRPLTGTHVSILARPRRARRLSSSGILPVRDKQSTKVQYKKQLIDAPGEFGKNEMGNPFIVAQDSDPVILGGPVRIGILTRKPRPAARPNGTPRRFPSSKYQSRLPGEASCCDSPARPVEPSCKSSLSLPARPLPVPNAGRPSRSRQLLPGRCQSLRLLLLPSRPLALLLVLLKRQGASPPVPAHRRACALPLQLR